MVSNSNKLKQLYPGGRAILGGALVATQAPGGAMLFARLGIGYLEVDGTRMLPSAASAISLMGRALGIPVIQRVSGSHRANFGPALEGGALGLSVPGVSSEDEAREVVSGSRYAPHGARGTFEPGPHNDYQDDPQDLTALNRNIHVTLRLPPETPAEEVRRIAALDGIDAIEFEAAAPDDHAGALASSVRAVREGGALLGAQAGCADDIVPLVQAGAQLLRFADDIDLLSGYFADSLSRLRAPVSEKRGAA